MRSFLVSFICCSLAACAANAPEAATAPAKAQSSTSAAAGDKPAKTQDAGTMAPRSGFPARVPGYTRIVAPVVADLQPGDDRMECQYVLAPFDRDMDVLDVTGYQSKYGHHVVAYATPSDVPIGTSRHCEGEDNLARAFLGGVGGEAGGAVNLPKGVAFRLAKGSGIMLNTHFINLGQEVIDGESVLDVKFAEADPSRTIAAMFVNINVAFKVPAMATGFADPECVLPRGMQIIMFSNHMHGLGTTVFSELRRATGGAAEMLRNDDTWSYEMQFKPEFNRWDPAVPLEVKAGDTVHTHCEWTNTTDKEVAFPDEMCAGIGLFLADASAPITAPVCLNGTWRE
jgi:hypothetical protein